MKNESTNEVILSFQELEEFSNYSNIINSEKFINYFKKIYNKLLNIIIEIENDKYVEAFNLFINYRIKKQEQKFFIRINEDYKFILDDITNFTKLDLIEFMSLKSSYAKNMFKLLKQFDKTNHDNWYKIQLCEFKILLDIPTSYKMSHIDSFVLSPIIVQLLPYFKDLKLEKIKKGVKVDALKFSWKVNKKNV
ncbi:MAG: replication initiation protein [Fusobacteriaceae bacterium]